MWWEPITPHPLATVLPAVPAQNGLRAVISAVSAKESVAVGIVSVDRAVDCINSVMSAALAVLSFVVNLRTLDLNFADAEVSLEVGHIVHGVPEAELYKRSQSQCFFSWCRCWSA